MRAGARTPRQTMLCEHCGPVPIGRFVAELNGQMLRECPRCGLLHVERVYPEATAASSR